MVVDWYVCKYVCACHSLTQTLSLLYCVEGRWSLGQHKMAAAFALCTLVALISENWQRKSVGKFVTNTHTRTHTEKGDGAFSCFVLLD